MKLLTLSIASTLAAAAAAATAAVAGTSSSVETVPVAETVPVSENTYSEENIQNAQSLLRETVKDKCASNFIQAEALQVDIYQYPANSKLGWSSTFFDRDYQTRYLYSTYIYGNLNFKIENGKYSEMYGRNINSGNITMVYHGYFFAAETGPYEFRVTASSGAQLKIGQPKACTDPVGDDFHASQTLEVVLKPNKMGSETGTKSFYLEKGQFYPIRIVYFNSCCMMNLEVSYLTPSKVKIPNIDANVYQLKFKDKC